tara:strand:+ start:18479 stop:18844 length:366 start_codon:yes stop_codon:yes gene_type:complete
MDINKMRDYSGDFEQIKDELKSLGFDELVNYLELNPPESTDTITTFAGSRPDQKRITLLPLVDALITAQKETSSFGVALHTLQSVMGQGAADRKRLENLRILLQKQGNQNRGKWFREVKRE